MHWTPTPHFPTSGPVLGGVHILVPDTNTKHISLSRSLAWPWLPCRAGKSAFAEWVEKIKSETLLRLPGQTMTSAQKLGSTAVCPALGRLQSEGPWPRRQSCRCRSHCHCWAEFLAAHCQDHATESPTQVGQDLRVCLLLALLPASLLSPSASVSDSVRASQHLLSLSCVCFAFRIGCVSVLPGYDDRTCPAEFIERESLALALPLPLPLPQRQRCDLCMESEKDNEPNSTELQHRSSGPGPCPNITEGHCKKYIETKKFCSYYYYYPFK